MSKSSFSIDQCSRRIAWPELDPLPLRQLITMAKAEDMEGAGLAARPTASGDPSSALLPADKWIEASLRPRRDMTVCGVELAPLVLEAYSPELRFQAACADGDALASGQTIGKVSGPARALLSAERPLLNFMQKLSGVSTITRQYADAMGNSPTRLLDTRKTTPGYRLLEKYAVACGGGWNHRIGLYDRAFLKDNHLAAFGDDPRQATINAVSESRRRNPDLPVEMEVDCIEQIEHALAAGVDVILLDNFSAEQLAAAVERIAGEALCEASGKITLQQLPKVAWLGLDFISTGATIHQSTWVDIGLDS